MNRSARSYKPVTDADVADLFKEIMLNCRAQRRGVKRFSLRALAHEIGVTENYLSAVENGREFPSLQAFLRYLLVNKFDLTPIKQLAIKDSEEDSESAKALSEKFELVNQIYSLDSNQVQFLAEQARIATRSKIKFKE